MSKKSRRRNRRLALLGALGAGLMLAGRGRNNAVSTPTTIQDSMPRGIDKKILDVPVSTPTTIQDSMPRVGMKKGDIQPKNVKSKRILPNTNKVFTIEGVKKGEAPKVGNEKSIFIGKDGYIRQGKDAVPMTTGRYGTYKAAQEMKKGALPPQLRVPEVRPTFDAPDFSDMDPLMISAKNGGRIVKGEKVAKLKKKKPIQVRGFGKARRG